MTWWMMVVIIMYLSWLGYEIYRSVRFQLAGKDEEVIQNNLKIATVNIGITIVSMLIVVVRKILA